MYESGKFDNNVCNGNKTLIRFGPRYCPMSKPSDNTDSLELETLVLTVSQKVIRHVIPAEAGIYNYMKMLDSRLRGNDINGPNLTFCEIISFG